MAGRVTVLTPQCESDAIELGRTTFRKQILPIGSLDYSGRKLNFTRAYLDNLVAGFKDRAFDACPLQLADAANGHTNEPDRAAGEIIGLEATDDGLYATVSATDKGAAILREHPNLGVSVRIVEDLERQDGTTAKRYPAALQHVLCTWAPRIAGMKPWAPIDCAQETTEVIDLSALVFTQQETPIPSASPGEVDTKEATPVAQLTDEELAAVRAVFPVIQKLAEPDEDTATAVDEAVVAEAETETADERELEDAIAASQPDTDNAVELAHIEMQSRIDQMEIRLAESQKVADAERWKNESDQLVRDCGIPPAIVALAEPLLKGSQHTVELAQGGSVDAGQVLRTVLHTVAKTYGKRVDLSAPVGTAQEMEAADQQAADRKRIHESARAAGFGN